MTGFIMTEYFLQVLVATGFKTTNATTLVIP